MLNFPKSYRLGSSQKLYLISMSVLTSYFLLVLSFYLFIYYFQVMAAEPVDEPILRVNCNQTALVLGGSVASAVPPDLLIDDSKVFMPLQGDVVKILASVLAPPLCPSVLSSKFRVAVLLYGLTGEFVHPYSASRNTCIYIEDLVYGCEFMFILG